MLENTPPPPPHPDSSAAVKRYVHPHRKNSVSRRKSGERIDRGNDVVGGGSGVVVSQNSYPPPHLIALEGSSRGPASQLLTNRWQAMMRIYNDVSIDLSERDPILSSKDKTTHSKEMYLSPEVVKEVKELLSEAICELKRLITSLDKYNNKEATKVGPKCQPHSTFEIQHSISSKQILPFDKQEENHTAQKKQNPNNLTPPPSLHPPHSIKKIDNTHTIDTKLNSLTTNNQNNTHHHSMLIEKKTGSIQNTEGITSSKWNIFPYLEVQKDLNLQVVIITQEVEARKGRDGVQPHPVRPPEYCCGWSVPPWWPRHVKLRDAAARGKRMMCSRAVEGLQTWAASVSKLFLGLFFDGPNNMTKLGLVGRDNGKQHEGDILVGAEGIRSKICRQKKTILSVEDVIALIGDRCDGVIGQLTEEWGETLFSALSRARGKAFSNMAVGYNNVDVNATNKYGVAVGNTPGVLTETTAELATSLALAAARRIVEADEFTRAGLYDGWLPNLFVGNLLKGQTVVVIRAARMGSVYARMMVEGFKMNLIYFDLFRATRLERFVTAYGEFQKANGEQPVTWRRAGIWSKVRTNSFGPKDAIYSGYTCYTGIADFVPVDIEIVRYRDRVFLDNKQYCASSDVSAGKLQWYTFYEEPAGGVDKSNSKKERLLQIFGGWCDNVIDLLQDKEENAILRRDIYDRTASLTWEKGCVTLLSDSIHALQLNMGHGGCMAIEDSYLWSLIAWKQSRESGSSVYEKAKRLQVNVLFFF